MNVVRVVAKGLSQYVYPFVATLLAVFVLSFVSLNILATHQSLDLDSALLWQKIVAGLLGLIWFIAALWLAYRKKNPILSANLSLALVLGNALMLEDIGDASSVGLCLIAWGVFTLLALIIYWVANKLKAVGWVRISCAVVGVGALVFISLFIVLLAMLVDGFVG
jgi:hypothetical protein